MTSSQTTILLAEDEVNDVFLMQRALKKANVPNPVQVVSDGVEVVAYLQGTESYADRNIFPLPLLILLDLKLPRRSGLEVLEWIRSQNSPIRRLPIVVFTSSKQASDINRAYELGANSYLVKPVDFEGLVDMVKGLEKYWFVLSQKPDVDCDVVSRFSRV